MLKMQTHTYMYAINTHLCRKYFQKCECISCEIYYIFTYAFIHITPLIHDYTHLFDLSESMKSMSLFKNWTFLLSE